MFLYTETFLLSIQNMLLYTKTFHLSSFKRSAMRVSSQLPVKGPTDVDDAPAPAC